MFINDVTYDYNMVFCSERSVIFVAQLRSMCMEVSGENGQQHMMKYAYAFKNMNMHLRKHGNFYICLRYGCGWMPVPAAPQGKGYPSTEIFLFLLEGCIDLQWTNSMSGIFLKFEITCFGASSLTFL